MLGWILLALVGVGLVALSVPVGPADPPSGWWGVAGGILVVLGAVVEAVRGRRGGRRRQLRR
ncbi:hypothetical protein QFZ62_002950 [Clavibacter sp. B3I6]|jgi:hypothetical protein|uniref:hypothetical protein n=1 Tax=Clavibacter sp. B3I6 TaxID=3042268 RepID=UPI00278BAAE2|nr:hypothetical protein [Clavibacter sp. B3I6]MDQ0745642.1 hypothetical protein [Clavibacter sp. B3I6]